MSKKLSNPFRYGQTVEKTCFFDRITEQSELKADFYNGQNVILMAARRYGKSSLIKKVMADLKKEKFLCLYIDFFRVNSPNKLENLYAKVLTEATNTPLKKVGAFFKQWGPRLKPKVIIQGDQVPDFSFELEPFSPTQTKNFAELLEATYRYTQKKKMKAVITFDEFQDVLAWGDESFLKEMRAIVQSHENISYCFAGSKSHMLSEIFLKKTSPFYHFGRILSLPRIHRKDFEKFLNKSFKALSLPNLSETIQQILDFTDCHPYYTQMLAYHFWDLRQREGLSDLTLAIERVLQFQQDPYITLWDRLTHRQKNLLICLAAGEKRPLSQAAVVEKWDLGSSATVSKALGILIEDGLVERMGKGEHEMADPFFRLWIRKL